MGEGLQPKNLWVSVFVSSRGEGGRPVIIVYNGKAAERDVTASEVPRNGFLHLTSCFTLTRRSTVKAFEDKGHPRTEVYIRRSKVMFILPFSDPMTTKIETSLRP